MPSLAKVAQRHNLVKKLNILFSRATRLAALDSLLWSSGAERGQRTEDDAIAVSQASESVKFGTTTSTIGDIEDQPEKNPFYSLHIGANESPQTFTAGQQSTHYQACLVEDASATQF